MNEDPVRIVWPLLAAIAGAVTALSFRLWQSMTRAQVAMSLFVGASFATFVGPLAAEWVFGAQGADYRKYGALLYVMATGSNILIPLAVKKLAQLVGTKSEGEA